jgi:hypothetical protein
MNRRLNLDPDARPPRQSDRIEMLIAAVHKSGDDVVDGARSRHRSAIAWFVGDGEKGSLFSAGQNDVIGP